MTTVGILHCKNYNNIKEKIQTLFDLHGGIKTFVQNSDRVLIKPNLLAPPRDENEPVVTHGQVILATAELLTDYGAIVSVGDSPAFGTVRSTLYKIGVGDALTRLGVKLIEFNHPIHKMKSFSLDKAVFECDKIINLPKLKVHAQLLLTLSVKNMFGCITGKRKPLLHFVHGDKDNNFGEMLVKLYDQIKPIFTIVDGIEAMDKKGPRGGVIKNLGYLFSGTDCVAIDRVLVQALSVAFEEYRILNAAKKLNIGQWRLNEINLLGEKQIPKLDLDIPLPIAISFSPIRILISTIKNALIKRKQKTLHKL